MAFPVMAKALVGITCLIASLWGLRHTELGSLKHRLMGMLQKGPPRPNFDNYKLSTCHACLEAGKDFCISENKCIERATLNCQGPYDHITGDKEFSLHGNPEVQHSMTCPKPNNDVDTKDCYFDKDCHAKVDWEKIGKIKGGFFARLKMFKEKDDAGAVKEMIVKVHAMFLDAGMPDDRIDYILLKWVKSVFPEAVGGDKKEGKAQWKMCTIAKERCMKAGEKVLGGRCGAAWEACRDEVMAMKKGADITMKKGADMQKDKVDVKDCYFDKECHAKVNWEKVGEVKKGFFGRLKFYKEKGDAAAVKIMVQKVHKMFLEAGMPDDRIDYILLKWVKFVYPEALEGGKQEDKPKKHVSMCAIAKMRCMKEGEKNLEGRCGMVWEKCGSELSQVGVVV